MQLKIIIDRLYIPLKNLAKNYYNLDLSCHVLVQSPDLHAPDNSNRHTFHSGMRKKELFYHPLTVLVISLGIHFLLSCGTNHGNLTVKTYPITGSVFVDGESLGDAPVTINLKTGEHDVSFSEYSEQYSIPANIKVQIENNKTMDITGIYKNRFFPAEPPGSFSPADSIRIYGTSERKLKDGSIFDYINGGGIVYLHHGLRETTHQVFQNESGNYLTVDIFDMSTLENSQAAFNDNEICPSEYTILDIGTECKVYHYKPDFFLYFSVSRYLVYIGIDNDYLKNICEQCAVIIHSRINGRK